MWKMVGSWSLMTALSPLCSASFGNISSPRLFAVSLSMRFSARRRRSSGRSAMSASTGRDWCHSSSVLSWESSDMNSR